MEILFPISLHTLISLIFTLIHPLSVWISLLSFFFFFRKGHIRTIFPDSFMFEKKSVVFVLERYHDCIHALESFSLEFCVYFSHLLLLHVVMKTYKMRPIWYISPLEVCWSESFREAELIVCVGVYTSFMQDIYIEIYEKELAPVIMELEKSQDL